ncbi:MSP domain [Macleaya cordata]|uniref:MSP domain n=1 Tax=Macleaya cordata TaxID=56857 RepID=A0A200QX76_MACCD|nr:MSP domain [Macleaya cordata]
MQAQREAPPDLQCKDKFLIQSTVVPVGTTTEDITPSTFSKDNGKYIEENKLRVVFIAPPHSPVLLPMNGASKHEPSNASPILGNQENLPPPLMVAKDVKVLQLAKDPEKLKLPEDLEDLKLANEVKELKSKLNQLVSKLSEAEITIRTLKEEKSTTIKERQTLQEELAILRRNDGVRRVQVGFPFLFVCMVALVSMTLGYLLRRWVY